MCDWNMKLARSFKSGQQIDDANLIKTEDYDANAISRANVVR